MYKQLFVLCICTSEVVFPSALSTSEHYDPPSKEWQHDNLPVQRGKAWKMHFSWLLDIEEDEDAKC